VDLRTAEGAADALAATERALSEVTRTRASLGRFETDVLRPSIDHGRVAMENLAASDPGATDYAEELRTLRELEVQALVTQNLQSLHKRLDASRVQGLLQI
jgi:hypothetical protein